VRFTSSRGRASEGGHIKFDIDGVDEDSASSGPFAVEYSRPSTAWKNVYEVRLSSDSEPGPSETGDAMIELWGVITNDGLEDWAEVDLTLVTSAPYRVFADLYGRAMDAPMMEMAEERRDPLRMRPRSLAAPTPGSAPKSVPTGPGYDEVESSVLRDAVSSFDAGTATILKGEAAKIRLSEFPVKVQSWVQWSTGGGPHAKKVLVVIPDDVSFVQSGVCRISTSAGMLLGESFVQTLRRGEPNFLAYSRARMTTVATQTVSKPHRVDVSTVQVVGASIMVDAVVRVMCIYTVKNYIVKKKGGKRMKTRITHRVRSGHDLLIDELPIDGGEVIKKELSGSTLELHLLCGRDVRFTVNTTRRVRKTYNMINPIDVRVVSGDAELLAAVGGIGEIRRLQRVAKGKDGRLDF